MLLRATAALLALLLVAPVLLPAGAEARSLQDIERELEQAQDERDRLDARIEQATVRFHDLETEIAEHEAGRDRLLAEVERLRVDLDHLDDLVATRVRTTFMHGSGLDPVSVFLGSEDAAGALARAQTVGRLVAVEQARADELVATRTELEAAEARLADSLAVLAEARTMQQQVGEQLQADLVRAGSLIDELSDEAQAERERLERERLERERRERERREREQRERERAAAAAAASSGTGATSSSAGGGSGSGAGGWACPLDHPRHFVDSWGAPRTGGRTHRGTDIMGPHGIPVRAITSGTWSIQSPGPSAGLWGILRADNGDQFWYMHLSSHTVGNGSRVSAGQQVGTNGSTGNAHPSAPHVHFEHHPGGGSAINPYPLLRRVCG